MTLVTIPLREFLMAKGYKAFSMTRSQVGHLRLTGLLGASEAMLLVDTGASNTVIDMAFAKKANIDLELTSELGGGLGTSTAQIYKMPPQQLVLPDFEAVDLEVFAMDLSITNEALSDRGDAAFDGVLGADFLEKYSAIIEYDTMTLYIKPISEK